MLTPVPIEQFGGLNLVDDPEEVGVSAATDLLNVDLDRRGRIRTRQGLAQYDTAGGSGAYFLAIPYTSLTNEMLYLIRGSGTTTTLDVMLNGTVIANIGTLGTGALVFPTVPSFTPFGTTTTEFMFIAVSELSAPKTLQKATSSTVANSVGKPGFVAVTPWGDNRLVQAYFDGAANSPTGANGSTSAVFFSDAGGPETFSANNYVHLEPGDGEVVSGMVRWRDLLFVAKKTSLFIFYGASTSSTGTPIFNYRRVSIPAKLYGSVSPNRGTIAAGHDGVYLLTDRGIYRTTGGEPVLLTGDVDPIFDGSADTSLAWDQDSSTKACLEVTDELVIMRYTTESAESKWLVLDTRTGQFVVWEFPDEIKALAWWQAAQPGPAQAYVVKGDTHVYKFADANTTDYGTAIESRYRSGFGDLGSPGVEKTVRETELTGIGSPSFAWSRDFGSLDTASAVTLGTSPATARGRHRVAKRGSVLSWQVSASSGAWRLNRVVPMLRETRGAGEKTS